MSIPFRRGMVGVLAIGAVSGWGAGAFAEESPKDVVVKLRVPQEADALTAVRRFERMTQSAPGAVDAQTLNPEQGVVRLRFGSAAQAHAAILKLKANGAVERAVPNFLYRPSIHYRTRPAAPPTRGFKPLAFAGALATGRLGEIPEVQLPGAQESGADPLAQQDWAVKSIGVNLDDAGRADRSMIAAVIDTGIDYNHEDLIAGLWRHPDNGKEIGYDFAHRVNAPYDVKHFDVEGCLNDFMCQIGFGTERFLVNPGHGTHCAGHVGAVANNNRGIQGVGAGTAVMSLKFFYDFGEDNAGSGDDAAAIQSIDYAIKNGAKVISASWGGRMNKEEAEKSELKAALVRAKEAGVLFVVAAGNDGIDQDADPRPSYPAAYDLDNLLVVGATDSADKIADFSNYGAKSVHIGAPGVKVLSTTVGGLYSDVVARFKDSNGNEQELAWDGTSMATPLVAGAAAAAWSKHPQESYLDIKKRILDSARRVEALGAKFGAGGVLDVKALLGN